ncbi:MAG: orotidine-5'-phosphate decarboxylase [Chloroflexota bacterium]
MTPFVDQLRACSEKNSSLLCVGLDVDPRLAPPDVVRRDNWITEFNRGIIEATQDLVCAYKPNLAFYEAQGASGWNALKSTVEMVPEGIPVIADAKRGDIGNTAEAYASAIFDHFGFHAVTVSPYLGADSLEPFLRREDRGIIVLCKTSNPGSGDLQDVLCQVDDRSIPLWELVAERVVSWNTRGNCGLVVGATYPAILERVRGIAPDMPILIPGIGPQAGDLEAAVTAGMPRSSSLVMINASRQVLYASRGADWKDASRQAALELRDAINSARNGSMETT